MKEVIVRYFDNGSGNVSGEMIGELVRCKECRISAIEGDDEEGTHYMWCSWIGHEVNPDDFCSYGVKKGADDDI